MNIQEIKEKYCVDAVNLSQYKIKKSLEKEKNLAEEQNFKTHEWKSKFVSAMKNLSPNFNGSIAEVERIVMSARVSGLNPEKAARQTFEYYKKFKPGTNGYKTWAKLNGSYSSSTRSNDPKERQDKVKKLEAMWKNK